MGQPGWTSSWNGQTRRSTISTTQSAGLSGRERPGCLWGFFFTLLYWVSEIVTASLILVGLGQPPLILESFVIQLILAILMMLPLTPGSSGIAEVGATSMYALFIPASIVGIFVVIWRIVLYYFNIALGILSSIIIVRREAKSVEK